MFIAQQYSFVCVFLSLNIPNILAKIVRSFHSRFHCLVEYYTLRMQVISRLCEYLDHEGISITYKQYYPRIDWIKLIQSTLLLQYLFIKQVRDFESMDRKESRCVKVNYKGEKQQGKQVIGNPAATLSIPPSQIKTSQQTASEYEEQHKLEVIVNKGWMQACANKSPRQFQQQFSDLVKKTINTEKSFYKKICYFSKILIHFINEKRFLLNWDISQILSVGKLKSADYIVLFKQEYLLRLKSNNQQYEAINQGSLRSIKNVIHTNYQLFKAQGIIEPYTKQQDTYLEQLKQYFFNLNLLAKESHFVILKSKINQILQDFMMVAFRNQCILIVTNILEILNRLHVNNKYFAEFLQLWLSNVSDKDEMSTIKLKLKMIHDRCIKMAKQYESDEENYKKPFQDRKKQKKSRQGSSKSTKADHNLSKSEPQVSIMTKRLQSPKIYIKGYATKHKIQKMKWIHQTYVNYIKVDRVNKINILDYKLQAKVKENQMNVLRYLCSIKRNFVFKYEISLDKHPENQQLQRENSPQESPICFEFQSRKADKDYATRVNQHFKKTIGKQDLWGYKNRNIIYNFFLCFAKSIDQLETNFIHHLDFSYENFIKFTQIFEVIDLEHAYVVDKNNQAFMKINRELFDIWLQSSLNGSYSLGHLIESEKKYSLFKKQFYEGLISKQKAIDKCIDLMYENMKKNHYSQFYKLCRGLLDQCLGYQEFPLSQYEVDDILREIPQKPISLEGFYKKFIQNLKIIYERYSHTRQIIGKSQYPLLKDVQKITNPQISQEIIQKTIYFVQKFQIQPLKNGLQYDQIIKEQQSIMVQSRRDHSLFDINHLYQKQRSLVIFLMSCVLLLQELEQNGLLLLNLGIQLFVRSGEAFLLKNFTYLFKIGPKYSDEGNFSTQLDAQFSKRSILVLTKLSFLERSELRDKLFDDNTLKRIYEIAFRDDGSSNMPTMQRIRRFFQRSSREIHFNQFKALALQLLQYAPKHFKNIVQLKAFVKQKNLNNFYNLFKDLKEMDIMSSY